MADESTTHALYLSAERQAEEYRQRVLQLERELEETRQQRDRWNVSQGVTYNDLVRAETELTELRAKVKKAIGILGQI